MTKIRRALISVYHKDGVIELAKFLTAQGVEILSSGGTQRVLNESGISSVAVSELTGFPEILGGRVKTIHPKIFGGILARRTKTHLNEIAGQGIDPVDLVVVNLYPFEQTIADPACTPENAIEQIDIGGPSLIRAAAKNHESVTVITNPKQYDQLISEIKNNHGKTTEKFRRQCAVQAFEITARYDVVISKYFQIHFEQTDSLPDIFVAQGRKIQSLRYGENPHQKAAFYQSGSEKPLHNFNKLHGKELSYNNIIDINAALNLVNEFQETACVILKHTNPCGAATGQTLSEAYQNALKTDSLSAFGGIIGLNKPLDMNTAELIAKHFFECVIAPGFDQNALARLQKKKNLRLIKYDAKSDHADSLEIKSVHGGLLVQSCDHAAMDIKKSKVVTDREPAEKEWQALDFAWKIVKHVKSNAIVFARTGQLIGVGAGQMSRVDSTELAVQKAHKSELSTEDTVVASDAFFPFRDGIEALAKAGATAVIQPGGSIRDEEVIEAANQFGLTMVFTGMRHFKH